MKKTMALLLALLMALSLCGCAESLRQIEIPPFPVVTPTPAPVTVTPEPTPDQDGQTATPQPGGEEEPAVTPAVQEKDASRIFVTIGKTIKLDYDPAEGTELILTFSYDMPRVYVEDKPEVTSLVNEALATIEETFYTGDNYDGEGRYFGYSAMLEMAEDNYSYVTETGTSGMPLEFSDTLSAQVTRCDENLLSVLYSESSYTGGAHGSYVSFAHLYDMQTGEELRLSDLSADPAALEDYLVQAMLQLAEQDEEEYYSQHIEDSFLPEGGREEAFRNLLRDGAWFFDRDGLVIFSTLYELGPYAAGITEFHIPYAQLQGHIDDRFLFPGERSGKGRVTAAPLDEIQGGELEIVDSLMVEEDGQQICFVVEGEIYDVSVETVYYSDRFYTNAQLWYANLLSDCALQVQTVVPDGLPSLRITYYTADGVRHGMLLSQSGLDGSYLLVDDDIEAVG